MKPPPVGETGGPPKRRSSATPFVVVAIVLGACAIVGLPVGGALVFPALMKAREKMQEAGCADHLRSQANALIAYAADHDDRLPPANNWMDAITPALAPDKNIRFLRRRESSVFRCPAVNRPSFGYAYSKALNMVPIGFLGAPANTPMTFDSRQLGRDAVASPPDAPEEGRHEGLNNYSYADGHVKSIRVGEPVPDGAPSGHPIDKAHSPPPGR